MTLSPIFAPPHIISTVKREGNDMERIDAENTYFAACNSHDGFVCRFNDILFTDDIKRIYILKGGPGTGKSYFMNAVGKRAESLGYEVEYFLCSSDVHSLDAILIPSLGCAVADGTAPHSVEAKYPGAVERIIDLGSFFIGDILSESASEIIALCGKKSRCYTRAYKYLKCVGELNELCDELLEDKIRYSSIKAELAKLLPSEVTRGGESVRLTRAIGVAGEAEVTGLEKRASKKIRITEFYGVGNTVCAAVCDMVRASGGELTVSYDPIMPERVCAVLCSDILFKVTDNEEEACEHTISSSSFVDKKSVKSILPHLKNAKKMTSALTAEAISHLHEAGELHSMIEKIYYPAVDIEAKEKFTEKFMSELFG